MAALSSLTVYSGSGIAETECKDLVSTYCMMQLQTTEYEAAEKDLNTAYQALKKAVSTPPFSAPASTVGALVAAQRHWIKQREHDCSLEHFLLYAPRQRRQKFECLTRMARQRNHYLNEVRECLVRGSNSQSCPDYGP